MDRYDIMQDSVSGDLMIQNNDLVYGLSDEQHVQDTINAAPGWWKENPADGVNIRAYLRSSGQEQVLAREIRIQLQSDLYKVTNPQVFFGADGQLIVQPNAEI